LTLCGQSEKAGDAQKAETYRKHHNILRSVAIKLKNATYRNGIITECKGVFLDRTGKFEENLDSQPNLLGFNNGVYDLDNGVFRKGKPEDMLTLSTNYDYVESVDPIKMQKWRDVLNSAFPNTEVARYFVDVMALSLSGRVQHETFYIHTGSGGNCKGVLGNLMELVFGSYFIKLASTMLTIAKQTRSGPEPELANTKGKRLAVATEPNENATFQNRCHQRMDRR
jgi:phage/plasmid-associated DNA primase